MTVFSSDTFVITYQVTRSDEQEEYNTNAFCVPALQVQKHMTSRSDTQGVLTSRKNPMFVVPYQKNIEKCIAELFPLRSANMTAENRPNCL